MSKFKNIANLIRTYRRIKRLTQQQLSNAIYVQHSSFIYNIERGRCGIPHDKIPVLAKALGLSNEEVVHAVMKDYSDELWREVNLHTVESTPVKSVLDNISPYAIV